MIQGIIFDMDGVLIDSELHYAHMIQNMFTEYGMEIPFSVCLEQVGKSFQDTMTTLTEYWTNTTCKEEFHQIYERYRNALNIKYKEILFDYVPELMQYCKKQGMKIAIASSSPLTVIHDMAHECALESYLDFMVSGENIAKNKPAPDIYLITAKKLGLRPEECIVVEDSPIGIAAAKTAGMFVIAKRHNVIPLEQNEADFTVESLAEIINYLKKNREKI